jgi:hypothetical protein
MIGSRARFAASSVADQIGTDDGELLGQCRCNPVPHDVSLREAMQKQQRSATSFTTDENRCVVNAYCLCFKSAEHLDLRVLR